jgi:acetate kinase
LKWLGVEVDEELNSQHGAGKNGQIGSGNSRVAVFVIPTNEELLIARDTVRVVTLKTE